MEPVKIIGAGLAGCEAAWQLAQRGIPVELHEDVYKRQLKIPMRERCESLNAAAAAAVVLWEMGR